jgi:hypothetical protein
MFCRRNKKERDSGATLLFLMKVAIRCNGQLIRWATYLQQKTMQCSLKKLRVLAALFCFTSICFSTYLIISSLRETSPLLPVAPIQVLPLAKESLPPPVITDKDYFRFHRLRLSLDSLAKTPSGRLCLDSILQKHPNLLDTLSLLENIYYEQHKN